MFARSRLLTQLDGLFQRALSA
jgi:uncharacterized membrane protein YgaE (UPF0421/DUF939 family)